MIAVGCDRGPDMRAVCLPSQPVELPADITLDGGGTGDRLECGQMPTLAAR